MIFTLESFEDSAFSDSSLTISARSKTRSSFVERSILGSWLRAALCSPCFPVLSSTLYLNEKLTFSPRVPFPLSSSYPMRSSAFESGEKGLVCPNTLASSATKWKNPISWTFSLYKRGITVDPYLCHQFAASGVTTPRATSKWLLATSLKTLVTASLSVGIAWPCKLC